MVQWPRHTTYIGARPWQIRSDPAAPATRNGGPASPTDLICCLDKSGSFLEGGAEASETLSSVSSPPLGTLVYDLSTNAIDFARTEAFPRGILNAPAFGRAIDDLMGPALGAPCREAANTGERRF